MAGKAEKSVGVRPLGDKVLLRRLEAMEKSKGGIVIPDAAKEKPTEGRVVALGTGRRMDDGTLVASDELGGDRAVGLDERTQCQRSEKG